MKMQTKAFTAHRPARPVPSVMVRAQATQSAVASQPAATGSSSDPLMLRALRGEPVERSPVWAMRQAGRCMQIYRDMCKKHPTFRERSETVELAVEVSLQPWRAFKPDGVILFSDILTPLPGMNIKFDILAKEGPVIREPIRTMEEVQRITKLNPSESVPFVGEALRRLRAEVGNEATVLGFIGAPWTLASYIVEGGTSKDYGKIKKMMFTEPEVLHAILERLADNQADYVRYQADAGAQVVQIFDSWAGELMPQDFDVFAGPYIKRIIDSVKKTHPTLPIILYISGSGGLLERMAACGPDVVSIDHSVDIDDAIKRIGPGFAIQGNMDPGVLFASKEVIEARVIDIVSKARKAGVRHIMNLGHGMLPTVSEDHIAQYFEVARTAHLRADLPPLQ